MKKILLTGIKPTGNPHIANYFGMMKQVVDMQKDYETRPFIPDLHALTSVNDGEVLRKNALDVAIDFAAIGLDLSETMLFKQSDVPQVTELAWIFNCITTMPYLMRAHAFKDAEAKNKDINVGTFDYPMLMAADILIQDADIVPVGKDQKQHVEFARDTAQKFNSIFGETFKLPEVMIKEDVATVPGIDGEKMSKSNKNTIPLFSTDEEIKSIVMKIATDSKGVGEEKNPDENNIFNIHKLLLDEKRLNDLRGKYISGIGYKEAKELLIDDLTEFITPMREKREEIAKNPEKIIELLKENGKKVREIAENKMVEIREKVGLSY